MAGVLHCAGSDAMYDPPGGRGFWARKSDLATGTTTFYRVAAMFAASSAHAHVYVEADREVPKSAIDGVLAAFENNIVPIEHVWFTTPTDIDRNGRVILLLLDIQDGYREGSSTGYIAGYFDPLNHYSEASVNALNRNYHSNQAEMLYLDTYPADVTRTAFFATLAHEYQHLLQFGKYYRGDQDDIEPTWVDEGLSEVASDLTGFGPQTSRANTFRSALITSTSLVRETEQFGLENYATTYIYFRYLADVYGLGGISTIFNDNRIGLASVNGSLQSLDSGLVSICGNTAGLSYPYFGCSYRFMWAAMIAGPLGSSPSGTIVRYNGTADSSLGSSPNYSYRLDISNAAYTQELASSLLNGSYEPLGTRTVSLYSYAPLLAKIKTDPPAPTFSSCSDCKLTLIQGSSYYVVFNHDATTSGTRMGSIADSVQPAPEQTPPLSVVEASLPIEHRVLHWHFPLKRAQRELLQ